jgi:hypothetical protein
MSESDAESDVEDQMVHAEGLDAGTGSQCLQLGEDWAQYLASADIPQNVSGVDASIEDVTQEDSTQEGRMNV